MEGDRILAMMMIMNGKNRLSTKGVKYRSKPDILASILNSINKQPLGKTRIMYMSFLSSLQLREYLAELRDKEMIEYDVVTRTYSTTDQGREYLRLYAAMQTLGE